MRGASLVILIVVTGLVLTYVGFLPINNVIDAMSHQQEHSSLVGYRNITAATYLKLKEETPLIAAKLIIDKVGYDYFQANFYLYSQQVLNSTDGDWFAQVLYAYVLRVGNHTNLDDSSVWFNEDGQVIRTQGIPEEGNLMPFKVTEDQAIAIARYVAKPGDYTRLDANIRNIGTFDLSPRVNKYAWVVSFWKVTSTDSVYGRSSGTSTDVILDVYTGWVYSVRTYQWEAVS
jgi:hypothetical protein